MDGKTIFKLACIATGWILLSIWYINMLAASEEPVTLMGILPLVFSAIIVFVPLYKKYFKNRNDGSRN